MDLVDDLADVLSRMVVGWEHVIGCNLAEHPDVVRVMARYRDSKPKRNTCDECGAEWYLVVDGRHITEEDMLHYNRIPKSVKRYIAHSLWCTKRPPG